MPSIRRQRLQEFHLFRSTTREFFRSLQDAGISFTQLKCLGMLGDAEKPVSLGSLSEDIGLSPAAVSRAVDGLGGRGVGDPLDEPHVGGTFGVAALGALFQHLARSDIAESLAGTGVTAAQQEHLAEGLGMASDAAGLPLAAAEAARNAFIHALSNGMWLSAAVGCSGGQVICRVLWRQMSRR